MIIIADVLIVFVGLLICYVQKVVEVDVFEDLGKVMEELLHAYIFVRVKNATYLSAFCGIDVEITQDLQVIFVT